jgi:two-component system chemotaxis response regulator CheY
MAHILIVDDSRMARRMLRAILERAGYEVMEAADGLEALELYALHRPDVVMLDMLMASMHGMEVLAQLRQIDPRARVIVATADVQISTQQMSVAAGSCGYVQKPFVDAEVLRMVEVALQGECHGSDA